MKKKLIIGIILLLLLIITGYVTLNENNKADSEIPSINSHIQSGNTKYNKAVESLNSKNYTQTIKHINESYKEYILANESTKSALDKASDNKQELQVEYLTITLNELDCKINATVEIYNGLNYVNSNPNSALSYFARSNQLMKNATQYSDKRSLLEQQYPDNFIEKLSK